MNLNKNEKILILASIFVIFLFIVIVFLSFSSSNKTAYQTTITPAPALINQDIKAQKELVNILDNRPSLSEKDSAARKKILINLNNQSGNIYATNDFVVSYLESADIFQTEITTTDVSKAKNNTVAWFLSQGFSKEGVCKLPLMFFLNYSIQNELQGTDIVFSPLPPGC